MNRGSPSVLYRILGNDLPPLQAPGQTLASLRYILRHEPELPGLEKRWLLNRIVSPAVAAELQDTIRNVGQRVDVIPFQIEEYRQVWTDIGNTPEEWHPWNESFTSLDPMDQVRVVEYISRHKNRYLINSNGARNQAIRLGLADAEWVFPWDGRCFLPLHAWQVLRPLTGIDGLSYIAVPMLRLSDNDLLASDPAVLSVQRAEPQLGFSRRAQLHFDSSLRYGSMAKAMLLRRIGLPGPWQESLEGVLAWEVPDQTPAPDAGAFVQAGVVFRLCAVETKEQDVELAGLQRLRLDSISHFTRRQDLESLRRFVTAQPLRCWTALGNHGLGLDASLQQSLSEQVVHRAAMARSLPTRPGSPDVGWLDLPWRAICALALDHRLHGSPDSLAQLRALLRGWFLEVGRFEGSSLQAPLPLALPGSSLTEELVDRLQGVFPLLDALSLARLAGALSPVELHGVESGLEALLHWLCRDSEAFLCAHQARPSATWYHLLVLAVSAHLGRCAFCVQAIDNLPGLVARQFHPDGSPRIAAGPLPIRQQLGNLQAWADLAILCSCLGRDLMAMRDERGHGLAAVFSHARRELLPHLLDPDDRAWAAWIDRFASGGAPISDPPPYPTAVTALPPFPVLCRRLEPLPPEPKPEGREGEQHAYAWAVEAR
jgi:hypothetical protein